MPDLHLLSGAYVLDALDDVERAGYERHLRSCGSCAAEVIEFQEATCSLADRVAVDPPVALKARVLAEVARTRQAPVTERARIRRPSLRQSLAAAAAAVVIAGSAGLGGVAWQANQSKNDSTAAAERAAEVNRVLLDPDRIEAVQEPAIGGTATVVAADGQAVLATDKLPAPPSGKTYQVWLIDENQKITSAGFLDLSNGSGQSLVSGVSEGDTVAVTVEPAGGSEQPSTTPFVAIEVA
jgi:anti-sigma-K factor RskA